jgi:hypothetical protein
MPFHSYLHGPWVTIMNGPIEVFQHVSFKLFADFLYGATSLSSAEKLLLDMLGRYKLRLSHIYLTVHVNFLDDRIDSSKNDCCFKLSLLAGIESQVIQSS